MDIQRFEQLSAAYGGDPRRWPQAVRAAADALRVREPSATAAILREADPLDAALDTSRPPVPSAALREAILAGAPKPGSRRLVLGLWDAIWLPRAGVAAAAIAIAGIVCGAVLIGAIGADTGGEAMVAAASATPEDTGAVTNWLEDRST